MAVLVCRPSFWAIVDGHCVSTYYRYILGERKPRRDATRSKSLAVRHDTAALPTGIYVRSTVSSSQRPARQGCVHGCDCSVIQKQNGYGTPCIIV